MLMDIPDCYETFWSFWEQPSSASSSLITDLASAERATEADIEPLIWALLHRGTTSKLGHGCITCPVCSFRVVAAQGCTHLTCPGCATPLCRQCGGIHCRGSKKANFQLSAGCIQLLTRAGIPVARSKSFTAKKTWFDHNSRVQATDAMEDKARAIMEDCFVEESQAEVYDEIPLEDGVRLVHPAYRLETFFTEDL